MSNQEQQDGTPADAAAAASPHLSAKGASRRRMAGLGASGVLMTLASNHAMAALVCKSPSGALSGRLSSQQPTETCQGRTTDFWKSQPASWPDHIAPNDPFGKIFPSRARLAAATCLEILEGHRYDKHHVGQHLMATYLNVVTGRIGFLTTENVLAMWTEYDSTREYVPAKGATPWTGRELVQYLSSTMG